MKQDLQSNQNSLTSRGPQLVPQLLLLVALAVVISTGIRIGLRPHNSYDFLPVYTGARCLLHSCDPYNTDDLQQQYLAADGKLTEMDGWGAIPPVYPPSTFVALAPLGMLNWKSARLVWEFMNGALLVWAAFLVFSQTGTKSQTFSVLLIIVLLFTEITLFRSAQPARFAISSLIIAVALFYRGQLLSIASLLLMLGLAVKPQLVGLPVLFLLLEKKHVKYVIASAGGALLLLLTGAARLSYTIKTSWIHELSENLRQTFLPGHINDLKTPAGAEVNLQGLTQVVFASDNFAKAASMGLSILLLGIWYVLHRRRHLKEDFPFLSLGTLCVLSLLFVYHRSGDTALLLITIPAVVGLYRSRRTLGILAAILLILSSIPSSQNLDAWGHTHLYSLWFYVLSHKPLFILVFRQETLDVIALGVLLLICMASSRIRNAPPEPSNPHRLQSEPALPPTF